MNLTPEAIQRAMGRLEALLPPPGRRLVGVSMSAQMHQRLRREPSLKPWGPVMGVQILVDPRMRSDQATAYYDARLWRRRCEDQNSWDAQQRKTR